MGLCLIAALLPGSRAVEAEPLGPDGISDGAAAPLVVHAALDFSTFLGGSENDFALAVAVDSAGNIYLTGGTDSIDFPLKAPYQGQLLGTDDAFVTKFDASGRNLVYSTYLGGSSSEFTWAIAVDSDGNAYLAGHTYSDDFPVVNAFQAQRPGYGDGTVTKLDASGAFLEYSTYLGGAGLDLALGIAVDDTGHAYVTGNTDSTDFPVVNPFQAVLGGGFDAFVTKFEPVGSAVTFSSYAGGADDDGGDAIASAPEGDAYVTGYTYSKDFPTVGPFQGEKGGTIDAYVLKTSPSGGSLAYSTYLGGLRRDRGYGVAVDPTGRAYVTGSTLSDDFPVQAPFQEQRAGGEDVFVTVFEPSGASLAFSTYLGGGTNDQGESIAVGTLGEALVVGNTSSTNFPTRFPFQSQNGGLSDAFVSAFSASGRPLIFSSYLGGSASDYGRSVAAGLAGQVVVVGSTSSLDFPTANAFQPEFAGGYADAFVTRIKIQACPHGPC